MAPSEIALRVGRYSTAAHSAALRGGTGSALERSCRSMLICASFFFFQAFHPIRPVIFWGFLLLPSPHAASVSRNPLCTVPGASLLSLAFLISAQWSTCQAATTAVRCFLLRFPGFGRRGERVRRKSPDLTCYSPLHRLASGFPHWMSAVSSRRICGIRSGQVRYLGSCPMLGMMGLLWSMVMPRGSRL